MIRVQQSLISHVQRCHNPLDEAAGLVIPEPLAGAVRPLPFISLLFLAAHTGVQREPIGLGHPFQSGIRSVQGADGADHEGLAPLPRANGDSI
jgi:hypothetical protein